MTRTLPMTVALFQFDVKKGDLKANLDAVSLAVKNAAASGADWLLLPELFTSSYDLENAKRWGEINEKDALPAIAQQARENRLSIAGSYILPLLGGGVGNTLVWIDPLGNEVARYTKLHRFRPMDEDRFLRPGNHPVITSTPYGPVGLSVCYDLRFPELYRYYATRGARFFFAPSQWPDPRQRHFVTLARARAIENQAVVMAVNRIGKENGHTFFGHSMVVNPWGETICNAQREEILLTCMFDPTEIQTIRKDFPVLHDIREDIWEREKILKTGKEAD